MGRTPDTLLPVGSRVLPLPSIRTPPLEVAPPGTEGISLPVHSPLTLPPSNCPHAPTFSLALEVGVRGPWPEAIVGNQAELERDGQGADRPRGLFIFPTTGLMHLYAACDRGLKSWKISV